MTCSSTPIARVRPSAQSDGIEAGLGPLSELLGEDAASCIGPIDLGEIGDGGKYCLLNYFVGRWECLKNV